MKPSFLWKGFEFMDNMQSVTRANVCTVLCARYNQSLSLLHQHGKPPAKAWVHTSRKQILLPKNSFQSYILHRLWFKWLQEQEMRYTSSCWAIHPENSKSYWEIRKANRKSRNDEADWWENWKDRNKGGNWVKIIELICSLVVKYRIVCLFTHFFTKLFILARLLMTCAASVCLQCL